jgi:serine kinase of HPr protein (carbohydrate metabolism regulator)
MLIHASCVAFDEQGQLLAVLLMGPAGSGKSDLALRLIDDGAKLIADDQTLLRVEGERLMASAPESIAGLMEVRHVGLMQMPHIQSAAVALQIDLAASHEKLERLPDADSILWLDRPVRRLRLPAFAASTPAKIRAALRYPIVTDDV